MRSRSSNVFAKAYFLMVLTPIRPGEEDALRAYLEGLASGARDRSPLARLPRTHIGRWMILPDMPHDPAAPHDHLDLAYLLFTSAFDGDLDSYLDELVFALAPEAPEIWGRCVGCPEPAAGAALKGYLEHNQLDAGFFFAAYGEAGVADVTRALDKRARLTALLLRTQGMDPADVQQELVREFAP
ncbi:MAG: hypothetical protein QOG42_1863 [Solirubrobacteraceae bacterium]|jgi:hypothetical protein|nr:hypothetical protein [Solirubrobacteraceae bacterium]